MSSLAAELEIHMYGSGPLISEQPQDGAKVLEIHFFSFFVGKSPSSLLFLRILPGKTPSYTSMS